KPATKKRANLNKNILKIQKVHARLNRIRNAYRLYVVNMLAKTKPASITIEKLNVDGMRRNKH
ncbi:transposase, partial [Bacillaceae bacterium Marseille-Q3522]|nr:transposase [Bacillaceae bacterium Marseille-Q3522]